MGAYFITSCGTDIGKTFVATALCWHSRRIGLSVQAIKPVASGWDYDDLSNNDTVKIISSLGLEPTAENIAQVSPWRFDAPRAPNVAAKMSGVDLNYGEIVAFCTECVFRVSGHLFIEGVGGVMSPLTDEKTCLDLIRDLGIEVILVVGSYLGSISHALTALEVLRGMKVKVIVTLKDANSDYSRDLMEYLGPRCDGAIYVQNYVPGGREQWKDTSGEIANFIRAGKVV